MKVYSKLKKNTGDTYSSDMTARTAWEVYIRSYPNMQIVRHIKQEKNADKSDLI